MIGPQHGPLSTRQAILGGVLIVLFVVVFVTALSIALGLQ